MMERMITYQSLFAQELFFDEKKKVQISSVVIPKIQRPYAQGREDAVSTNVRTKFLSEIFRVLSSEDESSMDLNFIYGTVVDNGADGYSLELLDGQQRITTLFLLHWYIAVRELNKDSDEYNSTVTALARFSYETRSSSREFCRHLSEYKPTLDSSPSHIIKKARWYYKSYDKDSTISAMLVMLDAIHTEYNKLESPALFDRLDRLQFYVLSLGQFDLSEELYVKMNARGLALSSFENFKADLLDYLSSTGIPEDRLLDFSTSLDTRWIDIFWNKEDEQFDASYLSFFYRFFVARYIIDHTEITPVEIRKDNFVSFLYTDAEKSLEVDYWGFQNFAGEICFGKAHGMDYVAEAAKVLDILLEYKEDLKSVFSPVWDNELVNDFFCNKSAKFEHSTLILFAAFLEFCRYQNFDIHVLKQWMRIVTNIVENSNIDSLEPVTVITRILSKMMEFAAPKMKSGATLHESLKDYDVSGVVRRAVVEEVFKCRYIASDPAWEDEFISAEMHPFLKGMVGFYLSDGITIEEFRRRTSVVFSMFNEKGITDEFRKDHLLIRSLISQLASWTELNRQYITETTDATKYLKNLIAGNTAIHEMFRNITALSSTSDIIEALKLETTKEKNIEYSNPDPFWQRSVPHCFERLRNDVRLYDWMAKVEGKRKCRVYYASGFVNIATPNAYYDRIVIDCERAEIIRHLISEFDLTFADKTQNALDTIGDVLCFRCALNKTYEHGTMSVSFSDDHILNITFRMHDKKNIEYYKLVLGDSLVLDSNDPNIIRISSCRYEFMDNTFNGIREMVADCVTKLQQVAIPDPAALQMTE